MRLYDISNPTNLPVLLDQEFFATDNVNLNNTGAVDFGCGRLYALDSNNGILAMTINSGGAQPPMLSLNRSGSNVVLIYTGVLQSSTDAAGGYRDVPGAASPFTINSPSDPTRFYRARGPN